MTHQEAPPPDELKTRVDVARELAQAAGSVLRRHFGAITSVIKKGEVDLVTIADQEAEAILVAGLRERFPEDSILAEEGGGHEQPGAVWRWVIDPLDGTTNFVHGIPHFVVSVGALYGGRPVLGVLHQPIETSTWWAGEGLGAHGPAGPVRVTPETSFGSALLATGFAYDRRERAEALAAGVERAITRARGLRRMGAAALDLLGVARGVFGGYWEDGLNPWDIAAGIVLVQEAGGRVTSYDGEAVDLHAGAVVASNGPLHEELLALANGQAPPTARDAS